MYFAKFEIGETKIVGNEGRVEGFFFFFCRGEHYERNPWVRGVG